MPSHRAAATARDGVRASNQNAVLQAVHRFGPISRKDVAEQLSLSPAAVTSITSDLIERGLVFEAREAEGNGVGRRAILLEVNYDQALVAGIKLSSAGLTCALTNLDASVVSTKTLELEDTSPTRVLAAIEAAVSELQADADRPVAALGINLPGIVDADRETVRFSPLLGWSNVRLGALLRDRLGLPVLVENDVNALALAEAWFGHGRQHDDFLVVTLGRGVGLGIVVGGDVYRGPSGGAGEFGHVLLDPEGPATRHAGKGTIEAFLSDDALVREARNRVSGFDAEAGPDQLVALARARHPQALAVLHDAGLTLGRALSLLVDIFAPPLIVLSGEGMRAAEWLLPPSREELRRLTFGDLAEHVEIEVAQWGDDAWARGAAGLAASRYLVDAATRVEVSS